MTGMLNNLIKRNSSIMSIPYNGVWGEIDNQNDLNIYRKEME